MPDLPKVIPIEQFLEDALSEASARRSTESFRLFTHCSESALGPKGALRWQAIFERCGATLQIASTGCCGMAGSFGHDPDKKAMSARLYDLSWRAPIDAAGERALATGFSCRCQAKRLSAHRPKHPLEALAKLLPVD